MTSLETTPPPSRPQVTLIDLALTFLRISSTSFGGAGIPMMRREIITNRKWLTDREFLDIYGIAQISPGSVPVSIAVLIGRKLAGTPGFFVALFAETIPGFLILMTVALISMDPHMAILRSALRGCAAAATGLLLGNSLELTYPYRGSIVDLGLVVAVAIAVLAFHASLFVVFLIFIPTAIALLRLQGRL